MNEQQRERIGAAPENQVCSPAADEHCATCSDEALPATVLSVDHENGLALAQAEGITTEIDITLVEHVLPGDVLLIHGGVAISRL